jgi:hypothetical protein
MDADTSYFCGEWKPHGIAYWGDKKIRTEYGEEKESEARLLSWEWWTQKVPGWRGGAIGARAAGSPNSGIIGGGQGSLVLGYIQNWMKTTYYEDHYDVFAREEYYRRKCCFSTESATVRGPEKNGPVEKGGSKNTFKTIKINGFTNTPTTTDTNPFKDATVVAHNTRGPGLRGPY